MNRRNMVIRLVAFCVVPLAYLGATIRGHFQHSSSPPHEFRFRAYHFASVGGCHSFAWWSAYWGKGLTIPGWSQPVRVGTISGRPIYGVTVAQPGNVLLVPTHRGCLTPYDATDMPSGV